MKTNYLGREYANLNAAAAAWAADQELSGNTEIPAHEQATLIQAYAPRNAAQGVRGDLWDRACIEALAARI